MNLSRKSVITAAAGALALGLFAPGAAASASVPSIEGYSDVVADEAISTLTSERGLSETAAAKLLQVQQRSVDTLDEVRSAIAGDLVGEHLDAQGNPVVTVATQAAADKAEAAGVTAELAERTTEQLDAARAKLEAAAVPHTSVGLDPAENQLVLTIGEKAADGAAGKLTSTARKLGDAVRVEHVAGGMKKSIYNGEAITGGGSRCSAGFNVNNGSQDYILDAGHCTGAVSQWNVGPSVDASFPGNDYGLIRNDTGSAPGAVTLWNGSTQAINSAANATVGQDICKSGSTTQLTCGTVQATNVTVNYAEGAVRGLVQTSARVDSGDSGGCLFSGSTGVGITSGMGGGSSYFQPVTEALSAYGMSLN
ncbi:Alpha-lytic protease prodomain-containing protein [Prauserella aidingensis]|uniref:S1 family peptidase n=1 Tax=Prauserella aidingensis TaxID=387890 RepID=UPI0020A5ED99|nr:S1 family peptidase [Prauserella aidingensis]MCP2253002.1 Alpha-lytic protease prodomain-containing protein [Prauserella aidingensis]